MSYSLDQATGLTAVFAVASAGAALTGLSGTATTYSSSAFGYAINGVCYANGANSGAATPTTDGNTGAAITLTANKARCIVWAVDSGGTEKVYAGPIVDYTGAPSGVVCPLPDIPGTVAPFAMHVLKGGSTLSGTWTFGSSNWDATGLTVGTVVNLCQRPTVPPTT